MSEPRPHLGVHISRMAGRCSILEPSLGRSAINGITPCSFRTVKRATPHPNALVSLFAALLDAGILVTKLPASLSQLQVAQALANPTFNVLLLVGQPLLLRRRRRPPPLQEPAPPRQVQLLQPLPPRPLFPRPLSPPQQQPNALNPARSVASPFHLAGILIAPSVLHLQVSNTSASGHPIKASGRFFKSPTIWSSVFSIRRTSSSKISLPGTSLKMSMARQLNPIALADRSAPPRPPQQLLLRCLLQSSPCSTAFNALVRIASLTLVMTLVTCGLIENPPPTSSLVIRSPESTTTCPPEPPPF